ncbi:hypothetical protein GLOIN_2v1776441 [Rhizophagus clarus]|uniref:Uncharacterized protein n=1 Tax=Rhizophagus clarus TaxID=94130 RepID=A0A8H3QWD1_9GLOM|nr:hypothetical protein GLOIN_2v1776441 [Rhizophagus clarus]
MFHHVAHSAILQIVANLLHPKFFQVSDFALYSHTTPAAPVAQDLIVVSGSSSMHQSILPISAMDLDLPVITIDLLPTFSSGKKQVEKVPKPIATFTKSSASSSPAKNTKSANDQCPKKIITRLSITDAQKPNICDILIYDILAKWSSEEILNQLTAWRIPLSMNIKGQKKYQMVCLHIALNSFTLGTLIADAEHIL